MPGLTSCSTLLSTARLRLAHAIFGLFILIYLIHGRQLFLQLSSFLLFLLSQQFSLFQFFCFCQHFRNGPFRNHFILGFSFVIALDQQLAGQEELLSGLLT